MYREIQTVMHEIKKRVLTVKKVENLNSKIKRITFFGEELGDFISMSPDDHIKVFMKDPQTGEEVMRDYTPRRFNQGTKELDLEFFLNGKGVAAKWAAMAKEGDTLIIGGPRGSRIVPYDFDWYLMIGDETSIPSFARRLEELPEGIKAEVILEVGSAQEVIALKEHPGVNVKWIFRDNERAGESVRFIKAIKDLSFLRGDYFTWISAEKHTTFEIQNYLLENKNAHKEWMKCTGYWNKGH